MLSHYQPYSLSPLLLFPFLPLLVLSSQPSPEDLTRELHTEQQLQQVQSRKSWQQATRKSRRTD